jgi:hypothetical protein
MIKQTIIEQKETRLYRLQQEMSPKYWRQKYLRHRIASLCHYDIIRLGLMVISRFKIDLV